MLSGSLTGILQQFGIQDVELNVPRIDYESSGLYIRHYHTKHPGIYFSGNGKIQHPSDKFQQRV